MPIKYNPRSYLLDSNMVGLIVAVMVKKLGGLVSIDQEDIDDIAYNRLMEEHFPDGTIEFNIEERKNVS